MTPKQASDTATGAGGTITLAGELFVVGQPTHADRALFLRHAKRNLRSALATIRGELKGLPPSAQEAAVKAAVEVDAGGGAEPTASFWREQLYSLEGCRLWCWLLLRRDQPDLKLADMERLIPSEEDVPWVHECLFKASRMDELAESPAQKN